MQVRPLGTTGLHVSPIGLGTVKFGRNTGVKYPTPFELPTDEHITALLRTAADQGVNLIDTAPAYGTSEERLGQLLTTVAPRDHWVICTKAGESFENGKSSFDFSHAAITASIERSLRRLGTDRVEIALLHSDGRDEEIILRSGGLEALRELQRRGLVRSVGISTKTPHGAMLAVEHCDVVMLTLNAVERGDAPAADAAGKRGVGVLVKKALASGHAASPEDSLRLALSTPGVSSVIVGTLSPDHLRSNITAAASAAAGHSRNTEQQT